MKWILIILSISVFLYLCLYIHKNRQPKANRMRINKLKTDIIASEVDFKNILRSSFEATSLYNKLKVKYHPDRFLNPEDKEIATDIYQEITANKHDYDKLVAIQKIAEKELETK